MTLATQSNADPRLTVLRPSVLVVDDDPQVLTALQRTFRNEPYELIATDDPFTALDWIKGRDIDLVPAVLVGAVISSLATLPLAMPFQASAHDIGLLALLGLVQLAIPCALSVMCARVLKAPEIALLALLEVIFGILLAWIGADEVPSQTVLAGGALVMGALIVNEMLSWRARAS